MTSTSLLQQSAEDERIVRGLLRRRAFMRLSTAGTLDHVWLGPPEATDEAEETLEVSAEVPADRGRPVVAISARASGVVLIGFGEPARLRAFLSSLVQEQSVRATLADAGVSTCFLPRSVSPAGPGAATMPPELASLLGLEHGRDWDWMFLEQLPASVPQRDDVELLDTGRAADVAAIAACLGQALPDTHALSDIPAHRWYAIRRDPGDPEAPLIAVIATDVPGTDDARGRAVSLSGLGVLPQLRGQGVGTMLLQGVMRRGLEIAPAIALGLWWDNHRARALYARLGFTMAFEVEYWRQHRH